VSFDPNDVNPESARLSLIASVGKFGAGLKFGRDCSLSKLGFLVLFVLEPYVFDTKGGCGSSILGRREMLLAKVLVRRDRWMMSSRPSLLEISSVRS
jgi:hypothetical protein